MKIVQTVSTAIVALAAAIVHADPAPLPDPGIPGFAFPETEATVLGWVNAPTPANLKSIDLHGWGLWTALTTPSGQSEFGLPNVPVYLTWLSPQEIAAQSTSALSAGRADGKRARVFRLEVPKQFLHDPAFVESQRRRAINPASRLKASVADSRDTSVLVTVGYDPAAAAFASKNNLFSLNALQAIYKAGNASIPAFPNNAVTIKPVYKVVNKSHMLPSGLYVMAAWPGTPDASKVDPKVGFPEEKWPGCVYVDSKNSGTSSASGVDPTCANPSAQNTYGLGDFVGYPITAGNIAQFQSLNPGEPIDVGDTVILIAMHVTSREITEWTWQTYFWTPNPAAPPLPSSTRVAANRPVQLKGPAAHYAMAIGYQMVMPNQPVTGGKSVGLPVIVYNPYLEAGFPANTFASPPTNVGIYNPLTKKTYQGNLGIQTNCMSCHAAASVPFGNPKQALNYLTDFYLSRTDASFKGNLQTEFLWSIPGNAK